MSVKSAINIIFMHIWKLKSNGEPQIIQKYKQPVYNIFPISPITETVNLNANY